MPAAETAGQITMRKLHELFPVLTSGAITRQAEQRQYVAQVLVDLATAGELYLTEILALPAVRDLAAQVILGHDLFEQRMRAGRRVPKTLRDYRVKIRSIEHMAPVQTANESGVLITKYAPVTKPITWKIASDDIEPMAKPSIERAGEMGIRVLSSASTFDADERVIHSEETEGEFSLEDAVYILQQYGKYVRRAKSKRLQSINWRWEEIPPACLQQEQPKRGRGRPPKNRDEVTA